MIRIHAYYLQYVPYRWYLCHGNYACLHGCRVQSRVEWPGYRTIEIRNRILFQRVANCTVLGAAVHSNRLRNVMQYLVRGHAFRVVIQASRGVWI